MTDTYLIELKDSVFRETPLTADEFDDNRQLEFPADADAEEWVHEQNRLYTDFNELTLHSAHPNDKSDVDAYVVFQPKNVWRPDPDT